MSFLNPPQPQIIQAPAPEAPEAPAPVPTQAPRGARPRRRSQTPTFLGEATAPSPNVGGVIGQNTLLGQ